MRHHRKPMSGLGSQQQCWEKKQKLRDKASCHVDGRDWQHMILSENMISQFNFTKSPLALETNTQCRREHTRFGGGGSVWNCSCQWAEKWADVQAVTATATSVALGVKWFEEHFTVCQGIQITTKVLLIPVPRPPLQRKFPLDREWIFFSPMAAQWRTLTICVISEDRYETPLTIERHFNIKGQMRGIPEEMKKSMRSKWAVFLHV